MRVGLIHIDGKLPNLALMKLSAWHKAQGHQVDLLKPDDVLLGQSLFAQWDKLYGATVFTDSRTIAERLARIGVEIGGTGWDLVKRLPPEVEAVKPDYELYGINYGFGFTSTGCIRKCEFCVVPIKEGGIKEVAWPSDLINPLSNELILLDNNYLASPLWREKSQQIIENGYKVDFTQGLDIRLVGQEQAEYLAAMKHRKRIHFAFDHLGIERDVRTGIELLLSKGIHHDRLSFYILVNFSSTIEQDLQRIAILDEYGVNSFVMVYDKQHAPQKIKHLARWCNKYQTKKSCTFAEYDPRKRRIS
ncbi:radical SAM protein [Anaerospora hongkongensis]|uniref:radical SAM protein n=1 Tax=Anaerospora hongkongensis TaxID=244830 RepID=UPI002FDAAEED